MERHGRRWSSSALNRWSAPFFAALIAASLLLAYQTRNRPDSDSQRTEAFRLDSTDNDLDQPADGSENPASPSQTTGANTGGPLTTEDGASPATFGTTDANDRPGLTVTIDPSTTVTTAVSTSTSTSTSTTAGVGDSRQTTTSTTAKPSTTTTTTTTTTATTTTTTTRRPSTTTTSPPPPVALVNGDFERLDVSPASFRIVATIPGWRSTTGEFEVWSAAHRSIDPASGDRFLELNANSPGSIFQDFTTTPGSTIRWQFSHRGRAGTETVELELGRPGRPLDSMVVASTGQAWKRYSGSYTVPAGQTTTRLTLTSRSPGSAGNLLDGISVQLAS